MKKYILSIFLFVLLVGEIAAQQLSGKVVELHHGEHQMPIPGANVYWLNTDLGTVTNTDGTFDIVAPTTFPATLVVSFVGYQTDSLELKTFPKKPINIVLKSNVALKEFEVVEKEATTKIDIVNPLLVEKLNQQEFEKAACCNISESFETNATVDVNFTDAVSGTKKIQMLGLDGIYTQIQAENLPLIRGLSSAFGLTFVPGTWAESIQIIKGAGSVVNGYESMTGQINIELLKPDEAENLFVNVYGNEKGRAELNIHGAQKWSEKWSSMTFAHVSNQSLEWDMNDDSFLDMPLKTQYNLFNRWKYQSKKFMTQFGVRGVYEELEAGQNSMTNENKLFKIGVQTKQFEAFSKTGFLFPEKKYKSIGIIQNFKYHEHLSDYGPKKFNAEQTSWYFNSIYQTIIGHTAHTVKFGGSMQYDLYDKNYNDSLFGREEVVPGAFTEYTYTGNKSALVLGLRGDYHNLYGAFVTPRVHYKYNFTQLSAWRISAGRGFRTANPFIENAGVMASARNVVTQNLQPEIAWNYGTSLTHNFELWGKEMTFSTDYYYTDFENQVVIDMENPNEIAFYNLDGKSFSHSFQTELHLRITEQLELRTAYKFYDIQTDYKSGRKTKPLVPTNRAFMNIAYATNFDKWKFDLTGQWFGTSRLPSTATNPAAHQIPPKSLSYFMFNGQITKAFKNLDVYLGVENLLNFTQDNPIIAASDPFGTHFDASLIWGSINGRITYAGIRYRFNKL